MSLDWKRDIELLTPCFCRGAYQDSPEIRVPSIRGMVRWWFRALGGSADDEKDLFGGMKNFGQRLSGEVRASRLVFRVAQVRVSRATPNPATLPHKSGGLASPQAAFMPGGSFQLQVFSRFNSAPDALFRKAEAALEAWTLLGSLGLRSNRAGGSLWPIGPATPQSPEQLTERLKELGCRWPVYLAGPELGQDLNALRAAATDTVSEPQWLFGSARGNRQASPLKLKVVRLEGKLRLLITAPDEKMIAEARKYLSNHRSRPEGWVKIA